MILQTPLLITTSSARPLCSIGQVSSSVTRNVRPERVLENTADRRQRRCRTIKKDRGRQESRRRLRQRQCEFEARVREEFWAWGDSYQIYRDPQLNFVINRPRKLIFTKKLLVVS